MKHEESKQQNRESTFKSTGRFQTKYVEEQPEPTADEMIEESIIEEDIVSLKNIKQAEEVKKGDRLISS
jgi:hypothetical protein